ncbi:MAG: hypothetical protein KKA05_04865 [Alphaproteobacteria bacterium]|nr:hypothetical protein [Alphaproteobacteria bacterium]MBU0858789.1 hypothetical protein [Alphaproteobacteria bacterium]
MKMICAHFLTVQRDDLFDLTRRICAMLPDDVMNDKDRPLVVGVNGTLQSGKKIISDAAIEALFDAGTAVMDGKAGYDEYWTGQRHGVPLEIDYVDMAYPYRREYSPRLDLPLIDGKRYPTPRRGDDNNKKLTDFMIQRDGGGITFLQNALLDYPAPGLSFFIETDRGATVNYSPACKLEATFALRDRFQAMGAKNPWARFVGVQVVDERLLRDAPFMDALVAFAPFCKIEPAGPAMNVTKIVPTVVPVYGQNFPQL